MMTPKPDIVISGLSGRFPSADSVEEYEYNLFNRVDMVTADASRWKVGKFFFVSLITRVNLLP